MVTISITSQIKIIIKLSKTKTTQSIITPIKLTHQITKIKRKAIRKTKRSGND